MSEDTVIVFLCITGIVMASLLSGWFPPQYIIFWLFQR